MLYIDVHEKRNDDSLRYWLSCYADIFGYLKENVLKQCGAAAPGMLTVFEHYFHLTLEQLH